MTVATLIFFSSNVVLFWYAFRFHADAIAVKGSLAWYLPGAFYVWVNCFGVIAPVQAWTFANQLFDTRQARRLFGLIAVGASLGSIGAGLLARVLVGPDRRDGQHDAGARRAHPGGSHHRVDRADATIHVHSPARRGAPAEASARRARCGELRQRRTCA